MAVVINSETKLTYKDLGVEIISASSGRKDRELKPALYQKARVPEYWLVDPQSQQVAVYALKGGRCRTLEGVAVDLNRVW